jgi:hypothetical protein
MRPLLCHLSYAAENRVDTESILLCIIPPNDVQQ